MLFDMGVMDALVNYMRYGLHPGSFGYAILTHNEEQAYRTAHAHLKPETTPHGEDIVANMLTFVKLKCPPCASGSPEIVDEWMKRAGVNGTALTDSELVQMKLAETTWIWWQEK